MWRKHRLRAPHHRLPRLRVRRSWHARKRRNGTTPQWRCGCAADAAVAAIGFDMYRWKRRCMVLRSDDGTGAVQCACRPHYQHEVAQDCGDGVAAGRVLLRKRAVYRGLPYAINTASNTGWFVVAAVRGLPTLRTHAPGNISTAGYLLARTDTRKHTHTYANMQAEEYIRNN